MRIGDRRLPPLRCGFRRTANLPSFPLLNPAAMSANTRFTSEL
jgi:hypothetical protein